MGVISMILWMSSFNIWTLMQSVAGSESGIGLLAVVHHWG